MQAELLFACALHIVAGRPPVDVCNDPEAIEIATAARAVAKQFNLSPSEFIAAGYHESGLQKGRRGARGEIGRWQILRRGAIQGGFLRLTDSQLEETSTNAWIAASYMASVKRRCSAHYLSRYNGNGCVTSGYEREISRAARLMRQMLGIKL